MSDTGKPFDVYDIAGGIADTLAIDSASLIVDEFFDVFRTVSGGEAATDAALGKNVLDQGVRGAVELGSRDDVCARFGDIHQGIFDGGHPRAHAKSFHSAFQSGDALFQDSVGGIADAGINVANHIVIEERRT